LNFAKRLTASAVLAFFMSQVSVPLWDGVRAARAASVSLEEMGTRALLKSEAALDDTDRTTGGARKANVLFMVEAAPPMSYTTRGVTPTTVRQWDWYNNEEAIDWVQTKKLYGMDFEDINRANWHATFGIGMMPPAYSGVDLRKERNLYGRERLGENDFKKGKDFDEDMELNKDRYYFPFKDPAAARAVKEAYGSQATKLETHFASVPSKPGSTSWNTGTASVQGASQTANWTYNKLNADKGLPYALVFKDPAYWAAPPDSWTSRDLVPNDSRMYATKLVLWRLLEEESLFKSIRFGLATTFLSPANGYIETGNHSGLKGRTDMNGIFRVDPFGSNVPTMRFFMKDQRDGDGKLIPSRFFQHGEFRPRKGLNHGETVYPREIAEWHATNNPVGITEKANPGTEYEQKWYSNGILTSPVTGHLRYWSGIHGQYVVLWQNLPIGLNYSMNNIKAGSQGGNEWNDRARSSYKVLNRASLHVPINDYSYKWEKTGKGGEKIAGMNISHADKFRLWINGFADIKSGKTHGDPNLSDGGVEVAAQDYPNHEDRWEQWHFYKDPEIGVAGSFSLPQAIFPDPRPEWKLNRELYIDNGWIWYSLKKRNANYITNFNQFSAELDAPGIPRAFFNAGSGEAAGSVLDFFSPPVFKNGSRNFSIPFKNTDQPNTWWDQNWNGEQYTGAHAQGNQIYVSSEYPNKTSNTAHGVKASGSDAVTWKDLDDVSYPIRSSCEDNWVILITSGQEVEPEDVPGAYKYTVADAIRNLYAHTRDNKVTMLERNADGTPKVDSNGNYDLREVKLDNPVRTIVIGIVADPDTMNSGPERDRVIKMRANVTRMARAGMGDDPDDTGSEVVPFFADNVETLFNNIRAALIAVNESQVQQPGVGAMTETPIMEGEAGTSVMFATTYRIVEGNQWDATLTRYVVSEDEEGNTVMSEGLEFGKNLLNARGARKLKYWGQGEAGKRFKEWNGTGLGRMLGMTASRVTASGLDISGYSPPMEDAFYLWFQGYDFSYKKSGQSAEYPRSSMLADLGGSGIAYGDYPASADALPGYGRWAARHVPNDSKLRLYAQGNDGVLHVIKPSTMEETDAILLPPVLLPWRLATLKTDVVDGKAQWRNVAGGERAARGLRSNPAYILDGSLQKKRIDMMEGSPLMEDREWGTYILGAMGRGGSGLYMLKLADPADSGLTDPSSPRLVWYREKLGDAHITMDGDMTEPSIAPMSKVTGREAAFSNIGFNSPMPAMGVTGWCEGEQRNFIALAGGTQSVYDPENNGREGAALLFLNAKDGSVIRAFDSGSLTSGLHIGGGVTGAAPYMGMMVSAPTLVRSDLDKYRVGSVYASDNRGNIFRVKLESVNGKGEMETLAPGKWAIDTVATLQESGGDARSSKYNYSVPHGLVCGMWSGSAWLAGGTSDVGSRTSDALPDGIIPNKRQMIFAFRDDGAISETKIRGADWKLLTGDGAETLTNADGKSGWFIPLEEDTVLNFREYVSAKPMLAAGVLFVPTFIQRRPLDINDASLCGLVRSINGDSRLYAVDLATGDGVFWDGENKTNRPKYITFEGIKITGMNLVESNSGPHLLLRHDFLSQKAYFPEQRRVRLLKDFTQVDLSGSGGVNLHPGGNIVNHWVRK
jgi:hypothetical protein